MSFHFIALLHSSARYISHACADGSSAWHHTLACAQALKDAGVIDGCTRICVGTHGLGDEPQDVREALQDEGGVFEHTRNIANSMQALVEQLCDIAGAETHVCLMFADAMISYEPLYKTMIETHLKYVAHYTRGEGYPESVSPEILSPMACKILERTLAELASTGEHTASLPVEKGALFSLVEKRINDYDIEAVLAPEDMRMLRVSLAADTRANFTIAKQLWDYGLRNPDTLMSLYHEKPQLLRGIPRYVYVQLTDALQPTVYDPHYAIMQKNGAGICDAAQRKQCTSMHGDVWRALLSKLPQYAEDATLALGFGGEVALHPNIFSFINEASAAFSAVYIETNGYEWDTSASWWNSVPSNVSWIVYLDAYSDELYSNVRESAACGGLTAQEAKARAHAFVEMLIVQTKPRNVFVQATRMVENENELDAFCKYWDEKGVSPIIEKYNDICGMLPNKKTVDLAPLQRFACRHLERDMFVDIDGNVRMCFQDLRRNHIQGSIVDDAIETLWQKNERLFVQQAQGHYTDICRSCDEYYTCNA